MDINFFLYFAVAIYIAGFIGSIGSTKYAIREGLICEIMK